MNNKNSTAIEPETQSDSLDELRAMWEVTVEYCYDNDISIEDADL